MNRLAANMAILMAVVLTLSVITLAETAPKTSNVTFVGVQRHESEPLCCYGGGTDQPLFADTYQYDVSLKSNCTVYTGRFENFMNYFPAFRPGQAVEAQIGKRVINLVTPGGDQLKMSIIDRTRVSGCHSGQ